MATVKIQSATKNPDGSVQVTFADGHGLLYGSVDDMRAVAIDEEADKAFLLRLLYQEALASDPSLSDTSRLDNKEATVTVSADVRASIQVK